MASPRPGGRGPRHPVRTGFPGNDPAVREVARQSDRTTVCHGFRGSSLFLVFAPGERLDHDADRRDQKTDAALECETQAGDTNASKSTRWVSKTGAWDHREERAWNDLVGLCVVTGTWVSALSWDQRIGVLNEVGMFVDPGFGFWTWERFQIDYPFVFASW